ncbi:MAG: hypothetical protein L0220_07180 [Acidobacteria bacterium]|nr:hypothetical protein [Acidobacteriota bacterium]
MKLRSGVFALSFIFACLTFVWAADVTGKWVAQVPRQGGETRETTFNFKVEGEKVTGTMSGFQGDVPISDGKISADDISFKVKISFNNNEVTFLFTGKVSGDEIKFTRTREGGNNPGTEFTAKRAK